MVLNPAYRQLPELAGFDDFLRAVRRSESTRRVYVAAARRYLAFADGGALEAEALGRYFGQRRAAVSQASVNLEIQALRAWGRFRHLCGLDPVDRSVLVPSTRKPAQRLPRALNDAEVGQLLAAPDLGTFVGFRDHVMMATLYQCGLRAAELVTMELGSVRIDGYLQVRGKGGRDRFVPHGAAWLGLLEAYVRLRRTVRPGKKAALWLTRHGKPFSRPRAVWVIVDRYARRALGLGCGYARLEAAAKRTPWQGHYPHLLRASFATELHRSGCNLSAIAEMLGHANLATTALYLGVDLELLRGAVARHPRAQRVAVP